MSRKQDPWVRLFDVTDPCRHKKGYTVYKVTSTVFPRNAPEAATQLFFWKRYSEFKTLHKSLFALHTNLHLSGTFPSFSKEHLFGRFDPEVIEERRQSALQLLEFVAQHSPLFTSQAFTKFFDGGQIENPVSHSEFFGNGPVLDPLRIQLSDLKADVGDFLKESVGSVQTTDCCYQSFDSELDSEEQNVFSRDDDRSNCDSLLSLFDPLCQEESCVVEMAVEEQVENVSRGSWLFTSFEPTCSSPENPLNSSDFVPFPKAFAEFDDEVNFGKLGDPVQSDNNASSSSSSDSVVQIEQDVEIFADVASNHELTKCTDEGEFFHEQKDLSFVQDCGVDEYSEDYLVNAAWKLKRAQECEDVGDIGGAFTVYKKVIDTLLSGVKEDLDSDRRDAVRRRINQYLKKAEELYETHLSKQEKPNDFLSTTASVPCIPCAATGSELRRYKVLGLVDKVLLVSDTETTSTCIIKVVQKSPVDHGRSKRLALPVDLPHVVSLLRYHETDESIFLVLTYASGGTLWNYVGSYLHSNVATGNVDVGDTFCDADSQNVYAGKKFMGELSQDQVTCSDEAKPDDVQKSFQPGFEATVCPEESRFDTDELVLKAKKLIDHIDATLRDTDAAHPVPVEHETPTVRKDVDHKKCKVRALSGDTFSTLGHNSLPCLHRNVSSGGSLELQQHSRVRRLSSVFRDLDRDNDGRSTCLPENCVRIWATEIATAIMALHSLNITCRDLKPSNILLDECAHVRVSYFGVLPGVEATVDPSAKEMFYVAPEVIGISHATKASDWWSFGALLYELLTGKTLASCHPGGFSSHVSLNIPCPMSAEAESLLRELLCYNPRERLGSGPDGDEAIRMHPFFGGNVEWTKPLEI